MDKSIFDLSFGRTLILQRTIYAIQLPTYLEDPILIIQITLRQAFDYVTTNVPGLTQENDRWWIAHNESMFENCKSALKDFYGF